MEDRETARMRKYGESKTTRIMMATVPHVTSGLGLIKFQADGFLLARVYKVAPISLGQCFSTAGPQPGTGPWHQLYRAARGLRKLQDFISPVHK